MPGSIEMRDNMAKRSYDQMRCLPGFPDFWGLFECVEAFEIRDPISHIKYEITFKNFVLADSPLLDEFVAKVASRIVEYLREAGQG